MSPTPKPARVPSRRVVAAVATLATTGTSLIFGSGNPASATPLSCTGGATPAVGTVVECTQPGQPGDIAVPEGATSVTIDLQGAGGGAGTGGSFRGGNAAAVSETVALPENTDAVRVVVGQGGAAGTIDGNTNTHSIGGEGSGVFAVDASGDLLAKLAIAGGGGAGAIYGAGGDAGADGTTVTPALNEGGRHGEGATGGRGGYGDSSGNAGSSNNATATTLAAGGRGGDIGYAGGGDGGGGYSAGGGGGVGVGGDGAYYAAGGGGGSSLTAAGATHVDQHLVVGSGGTSEHLAGADGRARLTFVHNPGVPTEVDAHAGNSSAKVTFTKPDDGGSPITKYVVTAHPGGATTDCTDLPCTVTGLENGTTYNFTVHAVNAVGESAESDASKDVTPMATAPDAPTHVVATAQPGAASITFDAPADDGGSQITGYTATVFPEGTTVACAASPCSIPNLKDGGWRSFTVHATNSVGDSAESQSSNSVGNKSGPWVLSLWDLERHDNTITFKHTYGWDGNDTITGYEVSLDNGDTWSAITDDVAVDGGRKATILLPDDRTHLFKVRVRAVNNTGKGDPSDTGYAERLLAPLAPTAVSATAANESATVSFTAPTDDGGTPVTSYKVTTGPSGETATCSSSPCTVTGLTNGVTHSFSVVALNQVGDSPSSSKTDGVVFRSVPYIPVNYTADRAGDKAALAFTAPADGGYEISGYEYKFDGGSWTSFTTQPGLDGKLHGLVKLPTSGYGYGVSVRAVNEAGPGEASNYALIFAPEAPDAPAKLTVKRDGTSATLTFAKPDANDSTVTGYEYTLDGGKTWHPLTSTTSGNTVTGTLTGLSTKGSYRVAVRAVTTTGRGAMSKAAAVKPVAKPHRTTHPKPRPWFVDPLTKAQRKHLVAVPKHPKSVHGKARLTRAAFRTHDGHLAVAPKTLRGHQLTKGQAVQLTGLFRFDSAGLSKNGQKTLRSMASHLKSVRSLTCEGYADYAGKRSREFTLARNRAVVVCRTLAKLTGAKVRTVSYGPDRPMVVGGKPADRTANRRVDVIVTK